MATMIMNLYSRHLQRSVPVTCIIPVDGVRYPSQPLSPMDKPMKAFYLLNGYFGGNLDWLMAGGASAIASKYNVAIFCPAGENKFYVDNPTTGENFGRYIGEELVEQTRRIFNISHKKEDTFIGGLSMGGYGALRNGLKYCDTFGYIVALSAGINDADEIRRKFQSATKPMAGFEESNASKISVTQLYFGTPEQHEGSDNDIKASALRAVAAGKAPKIYMACGTEDGLIDRNRNYAAFLKENGADITYEEGPGMHDYVFWKDYLARAAESFLPLSAQGGSGVHSEVRAK